VSILSAKPEITRFNASIAPRGDTTPTNSVRIAVANLTAAEVISLRETLDAVLHALWKGRPIS